MWDFFVGMLILYSVIVVPLQVGLNIQSGLGLEVFDYIVDSVFAIDMILTFLTAYEEDGKMKKRYEDIARNYLRTWFGVDLISTFPFDSIVAGASDSTLRTIKLVRVLRLFRLLKLLRILRLNRKLKDAKVSESLNPVVYQMAGLFTYIFFVAHILACAYFYIADCAHVSDDESTWRECGYRDDSSSQYLASLYFIMTIIFGVGYGDILLSTVRGRLFLIFVMFIGSITFGFVVATVSECVETWNPKLTARKLKMDEMLAYCNQREFKAPLKVAILRHFDYFYNKTSIFSEQTILQSMPILLHQSLLEHSRESCLNHLNLFQKEEHSTLTIILPHLKPTCIEPREVLIAENDYLTDMIFIMRGTIHASIQNEITADRLVLVGIFGPGSDFGSSNALYCNSLSWATYRATVVTDIMWLSYQLIQDSTGRMKELFITRAEEEERNRKEVLQYVSKSEEVGNIRMPAFILCDGNLISCRHAIRMLGGDDKAEASVHTAKVYKTIYIRGYDMEGRPDYVEDQETTLQMRLRYVINPYASYKLKFDFIVAVFALFSTITIPLRLGLDLPQNLAWNIVDLVTEILFFIDMIASFFTAYEQSDYSLNTVHKFIARRYLKSWFLIDFLSSIPFYRLSKAAKSFQALVLCKVFRIIRIFRLASFGKLFRFVNAQDNVTVNSEMIALRDGLNRILYSVGFVALFTHLCACFWSWIELPATERSWAKSIDITHDQYTSKYIAAAYWSYTTLSTVGYGDIVAQNDSERLFTILIFITGSSLTAYVVGLVQAYAFNKNGSKSTEEEKLALVRHYLTEQGISKALKEAIMKHFTHYIQKKTPFNEMEIWKDLPHHLRQQAVRQSYEKESHLLTSLNSHFKDSVFSMLLKYLEPALAPQGSYIYTFETGCDGLYFVLDGTAEVIDEDEHTKRETIIAQIRKGMFFGQEKIFGLTTDYLGVRGLTLLKLLYLRTRHIEHIKQYLPLLYSALVKAVEGTLQPPPPPKPKVNFPKGGIFAAEDQQQLAAMLANPAMMKLTQEKRGYSRQQSSIEEVIEWFAEDMDEMIITERGGILMGEYMNPNDPTGILSLNCIDRYRALRAAYEEAVSSRVNKIDEGSESSSDEENEAEKRDLVEKGEEEINSRQDMLKQFSKLLKSGRKHYAKIQINFHPRRERKYQPHSPAAAVAAAAEEVDGSKESKIIPQVTQSMTGDIAETKVPFADGDLPGPLKEEKSFHFDDDSD